MEPEPLHLTPTRLTLARQLRGFTKAQVTDQVGISRKSLWMYESGRQAPTAQVLQQLSDVLAVPRAFLVDTEIDAPAAAAISFRSLKRLPARRRDQVRAMAALAIQVSAWIDEMFELPMPDIPDWVFVDPETAAESLRNRWGLGLQPVPHLIHHLEVRGVRVFSMAPVVHQWDDIDALSFWYDQTPFILVNTSKQPSRLRMSLAHEVGHLILHQGEAFADRRQAELEATQFASSFLLPRDSMIACGVRTAHLNTLLDLKQQWGASIAALVYRLHTLGLLSERRYRSAFIELASLGWRLREPHNTEQGIAPESSQLLHKVLTELRAEGIMRADIARQLHLYGDDLDAVLTNLVPTALPTG